MPRFDFASDEWPPLAIGPCEGFADAVFRVLWDGKRVEIMARWVQIGKNAAFLFFKESEGPVFVVARLNKNTIFTSAFGDACMRDQKKINLAVECVTKALRGWGLNYGVGRRLLVQMSNTSETQWLFLLHDGKSGMLNDFTSSGRYPTLFRLESNQDLTFEMLQDPTSLVQFALDWSHLPFQQRLRRAVCLERGTWQELDNLVHAVAYFEPSCNKGNVKTRLFFGEGFYLSWNPPYWDTEMPNVRLRRLAVHIHRYFRPHRNEILSARHLCVAQQSIEPLVMLELLPPTQHERLEAALFLRDWARGKIPPDELRLLLPKL